MAAMATKGAMQEMSRALGRYELLRPLARGGMAEVYLARRRAAGIEKRLVVKRMRPETASNPRLLDLFVREARLSMSLVHQNIVPVFDFGRVDDQVFLAMERVEGKDLGLSLARAAGHRLPALLAAFIAAECCEALDYAHQRKGPDGVALGIVHRDVTPRNVLLSWSGEVKLTDFGIAALAGDATTRLLGTPEYMAPEQARKSTIDPRADVYAIGLVLREAVSGVCPRPGVDREAILDAARRGELIPWSQLMAASAVPAPAVAPAGTPDPDVESDDRMLGSGDYGPPAALAVDAIPEALIAIIDRATAVLPEDRYPDARSMLDDLDRFIIDQRVAQRGGSPARQLATWLAQVWEGERDDRDDLDDAGDGCDMLTLRDDGSSELPGPGTVRSLAATADDDGAVVAAPVQPVISQPPVAVIEPPAAVTVAPVRRHPRAATWTRGGRGKYLPLVASILLAALVVGSVLLVVAGNRTHGSARVEPAVRATDDAVALDQPTADPGKPSACLYRLHPTRGIIARRTRSAPEAKRHVTSPIRVTSATPTGRDLDEPGSCTAAD
jgi:serine/threonine protein kinase